MSLNCDLSQTVCDDDIDLCDAFVMRGWKVSRAGTDILTSLESNNVKLFSENTETSP